MRAGPASGTMQGVVVPTQVAANLFNRGLGVRLVNVMTDGLLYIVAGDPALATIESLRWRRIAVPFRNDTPELVFRRILKAKGMTAGSDLTVETTGTPIEAIQLLLAGRLDAALVPEPAATAAIVRAKADASLLGGLPLTFVGAAEGVMTRDRGLDDMARVLGAGPWTRLSTLALRHVSAHVFPALVLALGTAFEVAVMAEVLANTGGIGADWRTPGRTSTSPRRWRGCSSPSRL